MVSRYCST